MENSSESVDWSSLIDSAAFLASFATGQGVPQMYTCYKCLADYDEDDIVWADKEGNVRWHYFAWCVECLPAQKEVYKNEMHM